MVLTGKRLVNKNQWVDDKRWRHLTARCEGWASWWHDRSDRLPNILKVDAAFEAEVLLRRGSADFIRARRDTIPSPRGRIYDGICPKTRCSSRNFLDIAGGSIYVNLFGTLSNHWPTWHTHLCDTGKVSNCTGDLEVAQHAPSSHP